MIGKLVRQIRNSTHYSLEGLSYLLESEFAARIEVYAFFWVYGALLLLRVPLLYLASALILFLILLAVEALNTAVEVIIDRVSPEISPTGKRAKDLGSFSVMCLLVCNIVHLGYVLTKIDWRNIDEIVGTPGTLSILAALLFLIGIYGFMGSVSRKFLRWVLAILSAVFLAGFIWPIMPQPILLQGGIILLAILFGVFIFDLIGSRRLGVSQHLKNFKHRPIRIGREDLTTETQAAARAAKVEHPLRSALLGTLAIFISLVLHPAIHSHWM